MERMENEQGEGGEGRERGKGNGYWGGEGVSADVVHTMQLRHYITIGRFWCVGNQMGCDCYGIPPGREYTTA